MNAPVTPASFEPSVAAALLDPGLPVPHGIVSDNAPSVNRRFAVHRNNMVAGLIDALEARFAAVAKIVGKEFFVAMARAFVQERPPRSPLLAAYGDEFADFIGAFEPAHELPYLADVARIEAARTRAYHAAEASPLGVSALAQLDAKTLSGLRVDLHPSLEIVRSAYPVVTIWAMNSAAQKLEPIEVWNAEDALIVRPYLDVEVRLLPAGGAAFFHALAEGRSLGTAADAALADDAAFDLTGTLAALIGWGIASGCTSWEPNERGTS